MGYIKDYEGATLMGCELNPSIPYTEFSVIIKKQKEVRDFGYLYHCTCAHSLFAQPQIIKKLIERKQAQIRKVYPGLSCFKEGVRQIPIESIPGIRTCLCDQHRLCVQTCVTCEQTSFASTGETGWKPVGKG